MPNRLKYFLINYLDREKKKRTKKKANLQKEYKKTTLSFLGRDREGGGREYEKPRDGIKVNKERKRIKMFQITEVETRKI